GAVGAARLLVDRADRARGERGERLARGAGGGRSQATRIEDRQARGVGDGPLEGALAEGGAAERLEREGAEGGVEGGGDELDVDAGARVDRVEALVGDHRGRREALHEAGGVRLGEEQPRRP